MSEDRTYTVKFDVLLVDAGDSRIQMMGIIMDITGWGLKQSKDLIDQPPGVLLESVTHSQGMEIVQRLEAAGAQAELRRAVKFQNDEGE
jgi:large subunit ribosomal protein L7/L12